jgi:hypothetical protein
MKLHMISKQITRTATIFTIALLISLTVLTFLTTSTVPLSVPIVKAAGGEIRSIFSESSRLPMKEFVSLFVLQPASNRGCEKSTSLVSKVARAGRSVFTPFTVHAFTCYETTCGGAYQVQDVYDCCPGGDGTFIHFYADYITGNPNQASHQNGVTACGQGGCPDQCMEQACS